MSVPHALLALLSEGPKFGLQLREEFEARTGEVWPLNVGQVYKTLGRLERDGLAESEGNGDDGPQKRFRITAGGEAELAAWLRTPPDLTALLRDELVMKVLVAVRVPGVDVHEVIQAHRLYLVELMQELHPAERWRGPERTWASPWRWTPSCSGSTRSPGGWTPPCAAQAGRRRAANSRPRAGAPQLRRAVARAMSEPAAVTVLELRKRVEGRPAGHGRGARAGRGEPVGAGRRDGGGDGA